MIGNIYVHCRQGLENEEYQENEFIDFQGNIHKIFKFKHYEDLKQTLINSVELSTLLDIDLDIFTLDNRLIGVGKEFSYLTDEQINEMLKINRPLINWILNRVIGITIATEPEHCGGLLKSNELLNQRSTSIFSNQLIGILSENLQMEV